MIKESQRLTPAKQKRLELMAQAAEGARDAALELVTRADQPCAPSSSRHASSAENVVTIEQDAE